MKKLREGESADGSFEVQEFDATGVDPNAILRNQMLADGYADATQEEYDAQVAASRASDEATHAEEASSEQAPAEEAQA